MEGEYLCGWTIYYRPSDFPNHYAVRMWTVLEAGELLHREIAVLCDSLEEAREQIPVGAICFPRDPDDHPTICETWM